ncbi:glycerophosphodiester phosphodiesterase [Bacillus massiliigorillae]|uniref:glycerophosphodiester phosphodiesterase n=1 Tax=Bacillus massiliigorillae TaxID=1243664 RepID=UPI0006949BD7|nr:glycerophosphodiester phosphodiesterase [Bacillus massiliigorillae]
MLIILCILVIVSILICCFYMLQKGKRSNTTIDQKKPLIIAHRGAAGSYPENTHSAFQAALDLQADMLEFDIQLTKDNQFAVIHDETVDRTTNGKGLVREFTIEELKQLDAGSWKHPSFAGERIPAFTEMFEQYNSKVQMLIEVKHIFDIDKVAMLLVDFLRKKPHEHIIIQSFNSEFIKVFHQLLPNIPVGVLIKQQMNGITKKQVEDHASYASYINPRITNSSSQLLNTIHNQNAHCFIWTIRNEQQMKKALAINPDGIVTDYPEWFIKLNKSKKPASL